MSFLFNHSWVQDGQPSHKQLGLSCDQGSPAASGCFTKSRWILQMCCMTMAPIMELDNTFTSDFHLIYPSRTCFIEATLLGAMLTAHRKQETWKFKECCSFYCSSFSCRLALWTGLGAHTHAWPAICATAMQKEEAINWTSATCPEGGNTRNVVELHVYLQQEGHTCSLFSFCTRVRWRKLRSVCVCVCDAQVQWWPIKRGPSVCRSSRRRDSASPGNMPLAWANLPSCAMAAVLVVAAGLVCCRPTIGQRGMHCGASAWTEAWLKPELFQDY